MREAPDLKIKSWEGKKPEEMTPEERLDALAEVLAEGFLAIAEEDPEMKWLKEPIDDSSPDPSAVRKR
mgnify:CR=1 FL=1